MICPRCEEGRLIKKRIMFMDGALSDGYACIVCYFVVPTNVYQDMVGEAFEEALEEI